MCNIYITKINLRMLKCVTPAEGAVADMREPKSVVVPSEAPLSELGLTRQLLKDGGEEKVVPPPGRNDGSEKLRKSEEEGAEVVLLALVNRRPGRKKNRWVSKTERRGQGEHAKRKLLSKRRRGLMEENNNIWFPYYSPFIMRRPET